MKGEDNLDRLRAIIQGIEAHDDRSAAILAGAFLEDMIETEIREKLVPNQTMQDSFLGGPASNFATKIDLGVLLGCFSEDFAPQLHMIRRIRNRFAHESYLIDFSSNKLRDLIEQLPDPSVYAMMEVWFLNFKENPAFNKVIGFFTDLAKLPKTPRNRYISAVKFHVSLSYERRKLIDRFP